MLVCVRVFVSVGVRLSVCVVSAGACLLGFVCEVAQVFVCVFVNQFLCRLCLCVCVFVCVCKMDV